MRGPRRSRWSRHKNTVLDRDERFVLRRCATYLGRILERFGQVDHEGVSFAAWILGPEIEAVCAKLAERAPDDVGQALSDELQDAEDPDDVGRAVARALKRVSSATASRFVASLREALRRRAARLRYRGRSEHERALRRLQRTFDLDEKEAECCYLVYLVHNWPSMDRYMDDHLDCLRPCGRKYLAAMMDVSPGALGRITGGKPRRLGILDDSSPWLQLNDDYLPLFQESDESLLEQGLYRRAPRRALPLSCHQVDPAHTQHLLSLLSAPAETRGTHVLLYGPPGTGKSSYAHGLAREVGLPAFEVLSGEDNRRVTHRGAILACLNMTSHGAGSLVIVDEADRLLSTHGPWYWMSGLVDSDKGWLNYLLERPGVRMIWICNQVDGIDASTRRRFAFSVAFRPFGRRQRLQVWQTVARTHRVRRLLRPEEMQRLASEYRLGAGAIDLAVRTARQTADSSRPAFVQAVRAALESHRTLLNDGERFVEKDRVREDFTLDALNPDSDLEVVLRRLEAVDHALRASPAPGLALGAGVNLLLHGPPGTGKSELARFIADHLDREPLVRRASDLHSKWVGETEQRIARAFAEAEAEDAVLILDEVDTFLFGRDQAQRSWEVSFTNELLTRMERFRGILVCTTNRLEALDPASIRRFQIKLRLGYLTDEGKALLYQQMLAPLCDGAPGAGVPRELERIAPLSAGDFRVVREQIGVEGGVEHGRVVEALRREAALKKKQKRVGFGS